jgi:hypothetical protein
MTSTFGDSGVKIRMKHGTSVKTLKNKHLPQTVIHEYRKPPKTSKKPQKACSSTRNAASTSMIKQGKTIKSIKILKNPDIVKLAPYATSLISGKIDFVSKNKELSHSTSN